MEYNYCQFVMYLIFYHDYICHLQDLVPECFHHKLPSFLESPEQSDEESDSLSQYFNTQYSPLDDSLHTLNKHFELQSDNNYTVKTPHSMPCISSCGKTINANNGSSRMQQSKCHLFSNKGSSSSENKQLEIAPTMQNDTPKDDSSSNITTPIIHHVTKASGGDNTNIKKEMPLTPPSTPETIAELVAISSEMKHKHLVGSTLSAGDNEQSVPISLGNIYCTTQKT